MRLSIANLMTKNSVHITLGLILILAAYLRFNGLGDNSLWLDECYTVQFARAGFEGVLTGVASDIHPPLYYLIVHVVILALGASELVVRTPSAIFGILTCFVTFLLARMVAGRRFALLAALLLAVCPLAIDHSREARMYSLLPLMAGITTLAFLKLLDGVTRRRILIAGACGGLLLYTHYTGHIYFAALLLALMAPLSLNKEARAAAIKALALALALFIPWIPTVFTQFGLRREHLLRFSLESLRDMFTSNGPFWTVPDQSLRLLAGGLFLLSVALGVIGSFVGGHAESPARRKKKRVAYLLAVVLLAFVAICFLLSIARPFFLPKSGLSIYPVLMALCAYGLSYLSRPSWVWPCARALVAGSIAISLVALAIVGAAYNSPREYPDARGLCHFLEKQPSSELLLLVHNYNSAILRYYLPGAYQQYVAGRIVFINNMEELVTRLPNIRSFRRFWLVNLTNEPNFLQLLASDSLIEQRAVCFKGCYATLDSWPEDAN